MDCSRDSDYQQARLLIDALDLTPVIQRLISIENWSKAQANEACRQYRNYLFLKKKYGREYELPPSVDIDEIWHAHILHTEDYNNFCIKVFGGFLHHHPHHGKNNTLTTAQLERIYQEQTQRLYWLEFSEYLYAVRPTPIFKKKIFRIIKNLTTFFGTQKLVEPMEH